MTHIAFSSSPPQGLGMRLYCLTTIFSSDLLSHPLTITLYSVHLSVQCRGLLGEVMGTPIKQDDVTTKRLQHILHYVMHVYYILQLFGPLGSEGGVHL